VENQERTRIGTTQTDAPAGPGTADDVTQALNALVAPRQFTKRLVAVYALLVAVVAGSATGAALLATGHGVPTPWAPWKPTAHGTGKALAQIAAHVQPEYRLAGRAPLATVHPHPRLTIKLDLKKVAVTRIAIEPPAAAGQIRTLPMGGTVAYSLCGPGPLCAVPSAADAGALRREALELALYTLEYTPSENVLVFPPPVSGATSQLVFFFERRALSRALGKPLAATLGLPRTPPAAGKRPARGEASIGSLTEPALHAYRVTQLQAGGALLVLAPEPSLSQL
jgi:hypothetical protein